MKKRFIYISVFILTLILILYLSKGERRSFNTFILENLGDFVEYSEEENQSFGDRRQVSGPGEMSFLGEKYNFELKGIKSSDGQISLNIFSNWQIDKDSTRQLYCLSGENSRSFFSIIIHEKEELNISLSDYMSYLLNSVKEDSLEIFKIKEVSKGINIKEDIYFINLTSIYDSLNNEVFGLILENNNYIFDISYRTTGNDIKKISKLLFFYVLQTINICGYYIFPKKLELVEVDLLWE